ncbi:MAG: fumarylacetoacetate hydrolase family protein [Novosphingobium sp.]
MSENWEIAAIRLREAYRTGQVAPLRDLIEPADGEGAYAIQAINTRHWQESGRRIVGRKVGLTAKAVQQQLGVSQPDFGILFEDMRVANGGVADAGRFLQPKAEAEIALVLKADLPEGSAISQDDLAACVGEVRAAIEIVDSRIADWKISFADTVSDNGSSAAFVLSDDALALDGADLYSCGMVLERNGEIASIGAGAACLGHPLAAATWLANTLQGQGDRLRAGDIILTGALGPMVALQPGDHIRAVVGGIGEVSFSYGEQK